MNKTVKNISKQDLAVPNVGIVEAGEVATVPDWFHNPNFEEVKAGGKNSKPDTVTALSKKKADK